MRASRDNLGFLANLHRTWPDSLPGKPGNLRAIGVYLTTSEAACGANGTFMSYLDAKVEARKHFFTDTLRVLYNLEKGAMGPHQDAPEPSAVVLTRPRAA